MCVCVCVCVCEREREREREKEENLDIFGILYRNLVWNLVEVGKMVVLETQFHAEWTQTETINVIVANISRTYTHTSHTIFINSHTSTHTHIYIYHHHHHHHHHIVPLARISLTLSRLSSLRSSLLVVLQDYIPYLNRDAVCRFELVVLHLFGLMRSP